MIDDYIYFYNHERIQLKELHEALFYSCLLILGQFNLCNNRFFLLLMLFKDHTMPALLR